MIHFKTRSQEELREALLNYQLNLEVPIHVKSPWELAEYVFNSCKGIMPQATQDLFSGIFQFKEDLCSHLIFNCWTIDSLGSNEYVKNSSSLIRIAYDIFDLARIRKKENKLINDLLVSEEASRMGIKHFKKTLGAYLELPPDEQSFKTPAIFAPFVSYIALNYKIHGILKDTGTSKPNQTFINKHQNVIEKIHLKYYEYFNFLIKEFPVNGKVKSQFYDYNSVHNSLINKMIFEREYNLGLASKIFMMTNNIDSPVRSSYYKIMSLSALFANNGRLSYLINIYESINSSGRVYIDEDKATAIISMALIVIPIMELYFIYLWREGSLKFDEIHMRESMEHYEKYTYLEERVFPFSFETEEIKLKGVELFPFRLSSEWELVELEFSKIKPILESINKMTKTAKPISEIFLNPIGYLRSEIHYDKYRMSINEENPSYLIETVAELIEKQYFREYLA
ncbi:hypothetical protein [Paenibacillus sp. HW567]|uniref:hypothetical protein n=1 Tax=Paenibacillus sp. HW567 TaxID=1034769 RepID=UPI0003609E54|nr:hypothetical protein [Paenibacillus sp. HW567]